MNRKIIMYFIIAIALTAATTALAAVPHVMSYQGKATDKQGMPLNGEYKLTFRVYNAETGGELKWTEAHDAVQITNGVFQVTLGSVTPLDIAFDEPYWISLEINTDGEMTPRTRLSSAPYAFKAEKADSLTELAVVPFYKKGFEIEAVDFNSIRIMPGVMEVAGKMFSTTTYSPTLVLEYLDEPKNRDWVHGQKAAGIYVYVYAFSNSGQIGFKLSDEAPSVYDQTGSTIAVPYSYRQYPAVADGKYYRHIGTVVISEDGTIENIISKGAAEPVSVFSRFAGSGKDGDIVISVDTKFSELTGGKKYFEAKNLTVEAGKTLTVDTGVAYIGVKGLCTIHGTIDADQQGEIGGNYHLGTDGKAGLRADGLGNVTVIEDGGNPPETTMSPVQLPLDICASGAGGGGGCSGGVVSTRTGGCGGGAGGYGGKGGQPSGGNGANGQTTPENNIKYSAFLPLMVRYPGAGGGSGGGGDENGGIGGGVIYIESGTLIFDGELTADGEGFSGSGSDKGGAGGGGGGVILIRGSTIITNTGTVSVAGGKGEVTAGGDGGNGADGFKDIVLVQ